MSQRHKHADCIIAWANGAEIEYRSRARGNLLQSSGHWGPWHEVKHPQWLTFVGEFEEFDYRVKPVPHKWQKEMDAWNANKNIQCRVQAGVSWTQWHDWHKIKHPNVEPKWDDPKWEIRIKPEPVVKFVNAKLDVQSRALSIVFREQNGNLKLTFEDGKLIAAEVLK